MIPHYSSDVDTYYGNVLINLDSSGFSPKCRCGICAKNAQIIHIKLAFFVELCYYVFAIMEGHVNMINRIRQVTDSVHGTIFISELEHRMMSTPFFYRLHDVYQSSTVYMTFPSNRTKRYEHSLGTMELAGQMFYAAITNASVNDRKKFMTELQILFTNLLKQLEDRGSLNAVGFYSSEAKKLGRLIPKNGCTISAFRKLLDETIEQAPLQDHAISKQEVCFFDILDKNSKDPLEIIPEYAFLYQCVLEAIRMAALFHDIGHPPFSHIIEYTLQKLYSKKPKGYDEKKYTHFRRCLSKFVDCQAVEPMLLDRVIGSSGKQDPALHEQIGLHMLYNAYHGVFDQYIEELSPRYNDRSNRLRALYILTVIEFTLGILLEKNSLFASLHRIIDGPVDADRLDYCVRDSHNSGVDWGSVSYSRLISAAKFAYVDNKLIIAFPEKVCDDIDDMLVARYKVFQRINYHHKSVKTSELMQRTVEFLSEDYLRTPSGKEIMPEISMLWSSLGAAFGQDEVENQISQWTDSWLVSVLSKALIKLSDADTCSRLVDVEIGRSDAELERLYRMLEEMQLSRKRYYPLFKRQRDALLLAEKIKKLAGLDNETLRCLERHEYNKLISKSESEVSSAVEALHRLSAFEDQIMSVANFGLLDFLLRSQRTCEEMIGDVLESAKKECLIKDYFLWTNRGFMKVGVSASEEIFLYRRDNPPYRYNLFTSLYRKLNAQRAGCLWMYAYVSLADMSEEEREQRIQDLTDRIAESLGSGIHNVMQDLFDIDRVAKEIR